MSTTPNGSQTPKSRGVTLFDRQAQLHAYDSEGSAGQLRDSPLAPLRSVQSLTLTPPPPPIPARSTSPSVTPRRLPLPNPNRIQSSEILQETDFPLEETTPTLIPTNSLCCATVDRAFDYLDKHDDDDDDDDVVNVQDEQFNDENDNPSDGDDSVDTIDLDAATIHSRPSTNDGSSGISADQRHDSEEKLTDDPCATRTVPGGAVSEDNDSDLENQSHEDEMENDDEQVYEETFRQQAEQQKQLILRQQKIMWSIEQEWIRKETTFLDELEKLSQHVNGIPAANFLQALIQKLIVQHRYVLREVELLCERDQHPSNLLRPLTHAIETLMQTLVIYDEYIQENLSPLRKALEKRSISNGPSTEDLLSVLPKQFLQILSQVQDLHKTAQSFDSDDRESLRQLYDYAHKCKLFGSRQDENINKVILKNEDVAIKTIRGSRDRCHLILYPDAIVCSFLKTSLLTSPKYTLIWFIPVIDLVWNVPTAHTDPVETGDDLKSNLKSAYKELEKAPNTTALTSRLRKIRKQENEYNLAHSNLPLCFSNSTSSRSNVGYTILFSSAYQRQDWIDLLEKTKQELIQRSSTFLDPVNQHHQRLTENLIQKRLDFIKPPSHESTSADGSSVTQSSKAYSGTLLINIYSLHGSTLSNPIRSNASLTNTNSDNDHFYVAVEIDSYNTFHPYAQTSKRPMQQNDTVEFRGETFQIELEYSQAFRLLIYRIASTDPQQRPQCIGKFHRNIESALRECDRQLSGVLTIESPNDDLKLKISLKYAKRDGTFRRQPSKRNKAIFGKSIEILMSTSNGVIDGIPRIIVKCIEMVDREGLQETGIYRVCCVTSDLQKLRYEFDRQPLRAEELLASKNVHVAANLLKLFFRELPEPLFTTTLYRQFIHAAQLTDTDNQRVTLLKTFELLHPDNRRILLYLLDHLLRVSDYSHINMMHLENLAVVFGPTLMRPSKLFLSNNVPGTSQGLSGSHLDLASEADQMSSELQGSMHQCQVVLAYLKLRRDGLLK